MLFILITLLTGALVKYKLPAKAPFILFSIGILFHYLIQYNESFKFWQDITSESIFLFFVPPLIYYSSAHMNIHILRQYVQQLIILVLPVLAISIIGITVLFKIIEPTSWRIALFLGIIIAPTDPVAVLALLSHMNMSNKLKTLIDGEALLNDAVTYIAFSVLSSNTTENAIKNSIYIPFGSLALGCFVFLFLFQILKRIYDSDIEIALTIVFCYGCFFIAEELSLSGIFVTVIVGLWMAYIGKTAISSSVKKSLEHVWETLDANMNHLTFAIAGLVGMRTITLLSSHWWKAILLYLGANISRCIAILVFYPYLQHIKYRIHLKQLILVGLSNIKGTVTMALALKFLEHNPDQEIVLFYAFSVSLLSLIVNPLILNLFIQYVIQHEYDETVEYLLHVREKLYAVGNTAKTNLRDNHQYLQSIKWDYIEQMMIGPKSISRSQPNGIELDITNDIYLEYRVIYLSSLKKSFWELFDDHILYRDTIIELTEIVDNVLDSGDKHWAECVVQYCKFPQHYSWVPTWVQNKLLYHTINHRHNLLLGYILGNQMTLERLNTVFEMECDIVLALREEAEASVVSAKEFMKVIEDTYPHITAKIETRQAAHHILKKQQRYLKSIFKEGKINYYIYNHINQEIQNSLLT